MTQQDKQINKNRKNIKIDYRCSDLADKIVEIILPEIKKSKKKYFISVAGESGAGKTIFSFVLSKRLSEEGLGVCLLHQDDYFIYPPCENTKRRKEDINNIGTSEVKLALLDKHLKDISMGKKEIVKPFAIYENDKITDRKIKIGKSCIVIAEGTYTMLLKNTNKKIFLERDYNDSREERKFHLRKSKHKKEELQFLEKILKIEHKILSSHKKKADLIITRDLNIIRPSA